MVYTHRQDKYKSSRKLTTYFLYFYCTYFNFSLFYWNEPTPASSTVVHPRGPVEYDRGCVCECPSRWCCRALFLVNGRIASKYMPSVYARQTEAALTESVGRCPWRAMVRCAQPDLSQVPQPWARHSQKASLPNREIDSLAAPKTTGD